MHAVILKTGRPKPGPSLACPADCFHLSGESPPRFHPGRDGQEPQLLWKTEVPEEATDPSCCPEPGREPWVTGRRQSPPPRATGSLPAAPLPANAGPPRDLVPPGGGLGRVRVCLYLIYTYTSICI